MDLSSSVFCPQVNSSTFGLILLDSDESENLTNFSNVFEACNCTTWNSDTQDAKYISIIRIITSVFSVIGSASIVLLVLLTGKLNTGEVHPLFILSVADFVLAILWLIGGIVWLNPDEYGWAKEESATHTGMCYVLAVATTMAEIVTFLLTVVYAQSALLRIREYYINKGKPLVEKDKKKRFRHVVTGISYVLSWLLPLFVVLPVTESIVGIEATDQGCWCIVDFFNLRPDNGDVSGNSTFNRFAITQASLIGPFFILTACLIIVYYTATFWYAKKIYLIQTQLHSNQQQQAQLRVNKLQRVIKTVIVRLSFFVIIFIICGAPTFAGAIAVWSEKNRLHLSETSDKIILYFHAFLAPMQGFWNAIVYGWSRKEFRRAVKLQHRNRNVSNYESLNNSRVLPGEPQHT
jgi:hypothetical protein